MGHHSKTGQSASCNGSGNENEVPSLSAPIELKVVRQSASTGNGAQRSKIGTEAKPLA
jgi:hypothetical protein